MDVQGVLEGEARGGGLSQRTAGHLHFGSSFAWQSVDSGLLACIDNYNTVRMDYLRRQDDVEDFSYWGFRSCATALADHSIDRQSPVGYSIDFMTRIREFVPAPGLGSLSLDTNE